MGCQCKPSVPVVQFLEEQQHFNACNGVTMRKNGCETDCLPQGMSICPVPTDGFKKLKNLKVLTHEFEVESVLLKVSECHFSIPENPKNWT